MEVLSEFCDFIIEELVDGVEANYFLCKGGVTLRSRMKEMTCRWSRFISLSFR